MESERRRNGRDYLQIGLALIVVAVWFDDTPGRISGSMFLLYGGFALAAIGAILLLLDQRTSQRPPHGFPVDPVKTKDGSGEKR